MNLRVLEYPNGVKVLQVWIEDWEYEHGCGGGAVGHSPRKKMLGTGKWVDVPIVKMKEPIGNI